MIREIIDNVAQLAAHLGTQLQTDNAAQLAAHTEAQLRTDNATHA